MSDNVRLLKHMQSVCEELDYRWEIFEDILTDQLAIKVNYPHEDEEIELILGNSGDDVLIRAEEFATIEPGATKSVFDYLIRFQSDSESPKFTFRRVGAGISAQWIMPTDGSFPGPDAVDRVCHSIAAAVTQVRPRIAKIVEDSENVAVSGDPEDRVPAAAELDVLGRDLVDLALHREILPMYVREGLAHRLCSTLGGPKQQILLRGEPGTGKNALVNTLATWIANRAEPVDQAGLLNRHIYECTPSSFEVSCIYAHEVETKMELVMKNCLAEDAILFIDELEHAIAAGRSANRGNRSIGTLLIPHLSRGAITAIAATTHEGFKALNQEIPRLANCFHVIDVPESDHDETINIINHRMTHLSEGRASEPQYSFEEGLAEPLVDLADSFLRTRRDPGKSLELLNETILGAYEADSDDIIGRDHLESTIARIAGIRDEIVRSGASLPRQRVQNVLERDVIGQDAAVEAVSKVVTAYKAGLHPQGRPVSTMLFIGPTGVGKTQLARSLAAYVFGTEERLLRYDMSEFADPHGFTKLCGSRHSDEPGRLVRDVRTQPFAVILFDEIEKAHDTVLNMLLQVLGEGRLTDESANTCSFLNTIIIMTSNVGAETYGKGTLGFGSDDQRNGTSRQVEKELERVFRPEFLNRIADIVHFDHLTEDVITRIAQRELRALTERDGVKRRNIRIETTDRLLDHLVDAGYNPQYGARAMQRVVEKTIVPPLADLLAAEPDLADTRLKLGWSGTEVTIQEN